MANVVYLLCTLTSLTCAVMLLWGYLRDRVRLLLWSGACFVGLALNNILLVVDLIVVPQIDMSVIRGLTALVSLGILLVGLIWDAS